MMMKLNIVKNTTYVSNEQVNRQQAVFSHVQFTCLTQTHMKNLYTHTHTQTNKQTNAKHWGYYYHGLHGSTSCCKRQQPK